MSDAPKMSAEREDGSRKYARLTVVGANPRWTSDGQPVCSHHECEAYDGKRCGYHGMGCRPALHCEPAIIAIAAALDAARAETAELRRERDEARTVAAESGANFRALDEILGAHKVRARQMQERAERAEAALEELRAACAERDAAFPHPTDDEVATARGLAAEAAYERALAATPDLAAKRAADDRALAEAVLAGCKARMSGMADTWPDLDAIIARVRGR